MTTKKSYHQLQAELDKILAELQSPELDIDKAVVLYGQGQKTIALLEDYLKNAKNEITELKK